MKSSKKFFVFLGLPGSGKGTQAAYLASRENLPVIGIGDLIRDILKNSDLSDPFIQEIRKRYNEGTPQPDEVVFDLVKNKLKHLERGTIFDNFPFSTNQANFLKNLIEKNKWSQPIVIYLKIDSGTAVNRIIHRKTCSICGRIYTESDSTMCDRCGGALISRSDDQEDVVRERISHYIPRIEEVVGIFKPMGRVIIINGEPPVEEVKKEIKKALGQFNMTILK
jgi:adenylate kinase